MGLDGRSISVHSLWSFPEVSLAGRRTWTSVPKFDNSPANRARVKETPLISGGKVSVSKLTLRDSLFKTGRRRLALNWPGRWVWTRSLWNSLECCLRFPFGRLFQSYKHSKKAWRRNSDRIATSWRLIAFGSQFFWIWLTISFNATTAMSAHVAELASAFRFSMNLKMGKTYLYQIWPQNKL